MHLRVPLQLNSYASRDGRSLLFLECRNATGATKHWYPSHPFPRPQINRLRFAWALPQENPSVCFLPQGTSALQRIPSSNSSSKRRVTMQTSPLFAVRLLSFYPKKKLVLQINTMYFTDAFIRFTNIYQHSNNIIQGTFFNSVLNYSVLLLNC